MANFYPADSVTDLKTIHGNDLSNGDFALLVTSTYAFLYYLNSTSGETEDLVSVIAPITSPGAKRWKLIGVYGQEILANKAISFSTVNDTLYPTVKAVKDYADSLVLGLVDDRGNFNASGNAFPSSGGSGLSGAIMKGDIWSISVGGNLDGITVPAGAWVRALVDGAGNTGSDWAITGTAASYVYIAYASDASGTGFTTTYSSLLNYIAIKSSSVQIVTPVASDFTGLWKNYKGEKGDKGDTASSITNVAIVGDNIVFTKDDSSTITLIGAVTELKGGKGDQGDPGVDGEDGLDGLGMTPQAVGFTVSGGTTPKTLTVALDANVAGTNTGDNATNSQYSGLVTNATHTGDVTGATALTIANKVTMTATAPITVSGTPTVIAGGAVAIAIPAATASVNGYATSAQITKLDGIAVGATAYTDTMARSAVVSDTAYDASQWDGVTDYAPSKNVVRDKLEAMAVSKCVSDDVNTGTDDAKFITCLALSGSAVTTASKTQTLTNKRITPQILSATSYTTDTGTSLNIDNYDQFIVTAQADSLKLNNPTGTPTDGQKLIVAITGTAARALTYDTQFEASTVALPTTTVTTARLNIGFIWRADTSKWVCVAAS